MKTIRLNITLLLTLLMNIMCIEAFAKKIAVKNADGVTIYYYKISFKNELEVSFRGEQGTSVISYVGNVVIPSSVTYNGVTYSVTSIGEEAFFLCSELTSVEIPNSVTSIREGAFSNCRGLKSVTLGNSVTSIGSSAFYCCSGLTSIIIPNSVTSIGNSAFKGCSSLTSITIDNSVTSIGNSAFSDCSGLTSINLGNSVTSIGDRAFSGCSSLTSIIIPNSVTSIGSGAFSGCNIKKLFIPKTVNYIGGEFDKLQSVVIEDSETTLRSDGKFSCDTLYIGRNMQYTAVSAKIVIIDGLTTSISDKQFSGANIDEVIIGKSVKSIGEEAFYSLNNLKISIGSSITSGYSAFRECKISSVKIDLKKIPEGLFRFASIDNIIWGDKVEEIGNDAFMYCRMTNNTIPIPESVKTIGQNAFSNCELKSITIPKSIVSIGSHAFDNSNLVKVLWLPETPPDGYTQAAGVINYVRNDRYKSLNNQMIYPLLNNYFEVNGIIFVPVDSSKRICDAIDCVYSEKAKNIIIDKMVRNNDGEEMSIRHINPYACYGNGFINNMKITTIGDIGKYAFSKCGGIKSVYAKNQGIIGSYAFNACSNMETMKLGNDVTSIGASAFEDCKLLKSIVIPDNVKEIGDYAFSGCKKITNIKIGSKVDSIGSSAFQNCEEILQIEIPKSVLKIGDNAFDKCRSLKYVSIEDRDTVLTIGRSVSSSYDRWNNKVYNYYSIFRHSPLDSVYIGGDMIYETSPFSSNETLRTVTIGDNKKSIEPYEFSHCSKLIDVNIGNGVSVIGYDAFYNCSSLSTVSLGANVQKIGESVFSLYYPINYMPIRRIVSNSIIPPSCFKKAFSHIDKKKCKLYVPMSSLEAYKTADQWKDFLSIEEFDVNSQKYKIIYDIDGEMYKTIEQTYGTAISVESPPVKEGYRFCGWNNVPTTMPMHDIKIKGTFIPNIYKLTYIVDDNEYKQYELECGEPIVIEEGPTGKEGYSFSGWGEIPAAMPPYDVTASGKYVVNRYTLIYMLNDTVYKTVDYDYGANIVAEPIPHGDYLSFEWMDIPSTMPAENVIINATYTVGIKEVNKREYPSRFYSIDGRPLKHLRRGINIVLMSDGTTKKIIAK